MSTSGYVIEAQDLTDVVTRDNASITGADTDPQAAIGKRRGFHIHQLTDAEMQLAIAAIKEDYDEDVVVKAKSLLKFGTTLNADADVETTVMTLQGAERHETYVGTNAINYVSSDVLGDAGAVLKLQGHTISGSNFTFVAEQEITLHATDARIPVAIPTPLARASRVFNDDEITMPVTGNIYVQEGNTVTNGIPDTASDTHLMIRAGQQQSEKAATTFSSTDYGIIAGVYCGLNRATNGSAGLDWTIEVREFGKSFRAKMHGTLRNSGVSAQFIPLKPYIIVPANADVRLVVTSSHDDTRSLGWFNSYLATRRVE